jgi:putative transposase
MKYELHKASHSVYAIHLHIYFVTKYRRKVLTAPMITRIKEVVERICQKHKSNILESGVEPDHIHLLIDLHPDNNISGLVKSLKSATSQMIQKEFPSEFAQSYWGTSLWGRQKFIVSCGGAPLEIVKQYIASQDEPT